MPTPPDPTSAKALLTAIGRVAHRPSDRCPEYDIDDCDRCQRIARAIAPAFVAWLRANADRVAAVHTEPQPPSPSPADGDAPCRVDCYGLGHTVGFATSLADAIEAEVSRG